MANAIVINPIEVPEGREGEALAVWKRFADYFRRRPGYVSTTLHRAVDPGARFHFVNIAEWRTAEHFLNALNDQALAELAKTLPEDIRHFASLYEVILRDEAPPAAKLFDISILRT